MYLTQVTVDAPAHVPYAAPELRSELKRATAKADCVQHVHIEVHEQTIVFTLYIQAADCIEAGVRAEQLCRRTMAAVSVEHSWRIRSTHYGP